MWFRYVLLWTTLDDRNGIYCVSERVFPEFPEPSSGINNLGENGSVLGQPHWPFLLLGMVLSLATNTVITLLILFCGLKLDARRCSLFCE